MTAFILADVAIEDLDAYLASGYVATVPGIAAQFGGQYIARGGEVRELEGNWGAKRFIIIQFPDMEKLQAFWDSEAYAPWRRVRESLANSKIIAVDGLAEAVNVS